MVGFTGTCGACGKREKKKKASVRKKDIDELKPPNPPIKTPKSFVSLSNL